MTSSNSITCGSIASARAIATRCCWPPESRSGYSSSLSASPTRVSSASAFSRASASLRSSTLRLREADVLRARDLCGNRLNCWNTIPTRRRTKSTPSALSAACAGDLLALEQDPARLRRLEQVDAAQQGRLARPARADHADDLAALDVTARRRAAPRACRTACRRPREPASARRRGRSAGARCFHRAHLRPRHPGRGRAGRLGLAAALSRRRCAGSSPAGGRSGSRPAAPAGSSRQEQDRAQHQPGAVELSRSGCRSRPGPPRAPRSR